MEAKELRIGNYVSSNYGISEVFDINPNGLSIIFLEEIFCFDIEDYNPIPITEEWLLKLGFFMVGDIDDGMRYHKGFNLWKCNDLWLCNKNGVIIKSIHQLQNLYFALTGKELILKN